MFDSFSHNQIIFIWIYILLIRNFSKASYRFYTYTCQCQVILQIATSNLHKHDQLGSHCINFNNFRYKIVLYAPQRRAQRNWLPWTLTFGIIELEFYILYLRWIDILCKVIRWGDRFSLSWLISTASCRPASALSI